MLQERACSSTRTDCARADESRSCFGNWLAFSAYVPKPPVSLSTMPALCITWLLLMLGQMFIFGCAAGTWLFAGSSGCATDCSNIASNLQKARNVLDGTQRRGRDGLATRRPIDLQNGTLGRQ
jgi:hypothetical protein